MRYLLYSFIFSMSLVVVAQKPIQKFTSFDNTKIAYLDEGNGEAVLLVHGFISNGSSWYDTEIKKQLIKAGYRVIIPDLRGNGQSDRPVDANFYKNNAEVKDLIALIDHLKIQNYSAVGYSRGSIVLAELLTKDLRISQAVLGGMGIDFTKPEWDRRLAFADAFSGRTPLSPMTEGAVNYAKSIGANLKILGLLQDFQPCTSRSRLEKIQIPVLVIAGNEDIDNGDPKALKQSLPNATLNIVPGDHNTTYRKEAFAKAVLAFLQ